MCNDPYDPFMQSSAGGDDDDYWYSSVASTVLSYRKVFDESIVSVCQFAVYSSV